MTWEQAIQHIRENPEYASLVEDSYLSADLSANVEQFRLSTEFKATLEELDKVFKGHRDLHILDIGAGNGISTIAFALEGYQVTASEPDPSMTVGAGAIRSLIDIHNLSKVDVIEEFGEALPFDEGTFDIVYGRQVMHHAYDLPQFARDLYRVLRKGGVLMTTRDHVIKDQAEKEQFLARHPLQKFYGGENAFTLEEYQGAIEAAGLKVIRSLDAGQSPINYSPWGKEKVVGKIGVLGKLPLVADLAMLAVKFRLNRISGRLHTFVAIK